MRTLSLFFMVHFMTLTDIHAEQKTSVNNIIYFDKGTSLMWQDTPNVGKVLKSWLDNQALRECFMGDRNSCRDMGGDTAATYCKELQLGGFNDWKLPKAKEYRSLSIGDAYKHLQYRIVGDFWTSDLQSDYKKETESAWIIYFDIDGKPKSRMSRDKNTLNYVRCVRDDSDKQINKKAKYIEINNILYQNQSFSFSDSKRITTWIGAKEYCQKLEIGGHKEWRLPTHKELAKIFRVDVMYTLGDYHNIDDYARQFLSQVKVFVKKIKSKRVRSNRGSELLVNRAFVENMPLVNEKYPLGEFWTRDSRDMEYAMTLDVRNGVAWWGRKTRAINTLCVSDKVK